MLAINALCAERKLPMEVVLEAVEAALISAHKRNFGAASNIEVQIEPTTGDVRVFAVKEIVEDVQDPKAEILLTAAQRVDEGAELGGTVLIESTPRDFGRIAAQTAKQVILQRIREAERDALYSSFADSAGEIAHGTIQSIDYHSRDVVVNLDGAEAILPNREQVPSERYRRGFRLRSYVLDVRRGNRGPQITLSRRTPALLRRMLELEVPEIFNGAVEIKSIAREAGSRSKVAVHATQKGVDPVGSCVGVRGGRIQNVVNELSGEKIDVVQWDADVGTFIANALSPARVMNVLLEENPESGKTATVIVPDRQLSLAIGKEGQNARLAAKLTGWRIDIKSATEAAEETLGRLEDLTIAPEDMDLLRMAEAILQKRETGELSADQRQLIQAQVDAGRLEGVPWPDAEPQLEVGADQQPEAVSAVDAPDDGEGVSESDSEVADLEGVTEKVERPAGAVGAVDLEGEAVRPKDQAEPTSERELEPVLADDIDDSLGWVVVEPEVDYYSGWDGAEKLEPESEVEWVREEIDEIVEQRAGKPAKRKKKGGKPRFGRGGRDR